MRRSILVVAAHPDDEVLGCGGTIAKWKRRGDEVHVLLMTDGEGARVGNDETLIKIRNKAAVAANVLLGTDSLHALKLPDNRMDSVSLLDVVKIIEDYIGRFHPDVVLTHHVGDVNIDHRIVHDAVIAACRPQPGFSVNELLFFEIPSSTEWRPPGSGPPFVPNVFVDVSDCFENKAAALQAYKNELRIFPHPRSVEAIQALARWRGAMVGVPMAEAFMLGRLIV